MLTTAIQISIEIAIDININRTKQIAHHSNRSKKKKKPRSKFDISPQLIQEFGKKARENDVKDMPGFINTMLSTYAEFETNKAAKIVRCTQPAANICDLKVTECKSLQNVLNVLISYRNFIQNRNRINIYNDVFRSGEKGLVHALNDHHHLISCHQDEFEDIFNVINSVLFNNNGGDLSNCLCLQRNRRDRSEMTQNPEFLRNLYFGSDIVEQQLLDTIHCNFMHSFDRGMRLKRSECALITQEQKSNDGTTIDYEKLRRIIQPKVVNKNNFGSKFVTENESKDSNDSTEFNTNDYKYGQRFYYHKMYK